MKLGIVSPLIAACVLACGPGQILGPTSPVGPDLEADAECLAGQLIAGNLDPVAVFAACKVSETQTIDDLWTFLVDALTSNGKLTAQQNADAHAKMAAHKAATP